MIFFMTPKCKPIDKLFDLLSSNHALMPFRPEYVTISMNMVDNLLSVFPI